MKIVNFDDFGKPIPKGINWEYFSIPNSNIILKGYIFCGVFRALGLK